MSACDHGLGYNCLQQRHVLLEPLESCIEASADLVVQSRDTVWRAFKSYRGREVDIEGKDGFTKLKAKPLAQSSTTLL